MNLRITIAVLSVLFVASCVTPDAISVREFDSTKETKKGMIFGSIGSPAENSGIKARYIKFRQVGSDKAGTISHISDMAVQTPVDIKGAVSASVFTASVPAGEYEIFAVEFMAREAIPTFVYRLESANLFSVRFKVEAEKAVYVGELTSQVASPARAGRNSTDRLRRINVSTYGQSVVGLVADDVYFSVRDCLDRDKGIVMRRGQLNANTDVSTVINKIQDSKTTFLVSAPVRSNRNTACEG
jgi:hypothetical protein